MAKQQRRRFERGSTHADFSTPLPQMSEQELVRAVEKNESALVLVLDCVQDPHNLGACMRSANAAGAIAVVIPKDKSAGLTDVARHVASGAAEHTPLVAVTNLSRTMEKLKDAGMWFVGTSDRGESAIYDIDMRGRTGIVMGMEGTGLRRLVAESCDYLAVIPMVGQVDCLNVSVATGVCLFEAVRQRFA